MKTTRIFQCKVFQTQTYIVDTYIMVIIYANVSAIYLCLVTEQNNPISTKVNVIFIYLLINFFPSGNLGEKMV
jgi:hypothetical protein